MIRTNTVDPGSATVRQFSRMGSARRRNSSTSSVSIIDGWVDSPAAKVKATSFIEKNFRIRECNKFVKGTKWKNDKPDVTRCRCGNKKSWHDQHGIQENSVIVENEWKSAFHTVLRPTNAFGEINYVNHAQKLHRPKYIRVKHDTEPALLLRLLQNYWGLRKPKLVISVTGGAQKFKLVPKLREVFRRGLMKAAQSTGAYIISGGSYAGVMKYVGEAVRDSSLIRTGEGGESLVAIGIATWGTVLGKDKLIKPGGLLADYRPTKPNPHKDDTGAPLDPNHTHFILVDNGTIGQFGVEIDLRSKFEQAISEQKMQTYKTSGNLGFRIPIVCVVLEGGPNTMATVHAAIEQGTPGVVVADSGRAANIISYAYYHTYSVVECNNKNENIENHYIIPEFEDEVVDKIYKEFGWTKEKNEAKCMKCLEQVKQCLKKKSMITIYHADDGELDAAILQALMKANPSSKKTQLNLALTWNKLEVATNQIFDGKKWKSTDLELAMMTALESNNVDFVKLFIEHGLKANEFLTKKRLEELYGSIPKYGILNVLLNDHRRGNSGDKSMKLSSVGKVISQLMGSSFGNIYASDEESIDQSYYEKDDIDCDVKAYDSDSSSDEESSKRLDFEDPYQHLFLWSILRNRSQMAFYMWQKVRNPMAAALVAYKIFKKMHVVAMNAAATDVSAELLRNANNFEELAIGVMDECYNMNEENAIKLLKKELPRWCNTTCLTLAENAKSEGFISHQCCQTLLTDLWSGTMNPETPSYKITISACLPLIVIWTNWIEFHQHDQTKTVKHKQLMTNSVQRVGSDVELIGANAVDTLEVSESQGSNEDVAVVSYHNRLKSCCDMRRIPNFYSAPRTKFVVNSISFFCYIFLYAYVILSDFQSPYPGIAEYILIAWTASLLTEEIRQLAQSQGDSFFEKIADYLSDLWNIADVTALTVLVTAIALRFFAETREAGRIIYCLGFLIYCLRLLQIYSVSIHFGPLLVMIKNMVKDLALFVIILGVFLIAYGVSSQAILHPNYPFNTTIIRQIFYIPYFQIYGELFLPEIQGETCPPGANYTTDPIHCVANKWMVPILLTGYLLVTNILLINLLIAMFNNTYSKVQERSDVVWKFQRYGLISEYLERPSFPPPFIMISHVLLLIQLFAKCYHGRISQSRTFVIYTKSAFRISMPKGKDQQLELWECEAADTYCQQTESQKLDSIEARVKLSGERLEHMAAVLTTKDHAVREHRIRPTTAAPEEPGSLQKIERRLEDLEVRTMEMFEAVLEALDKKSPLSDGGRRLSQFHAESIPVTVTTLKIHDAVPVQHEQIGRFGRKLHKKARKSPYPNTVIRRFTVPDNYVAWEVAYPEYDPVSHTDEVVLAMPRWADPDILQLGIHHPDTIKIQYNCLDSEFNANRVSYEGDYQVVDGLPLNPQGRTGLKGRGLLGRWGPNHAADPIVTRWKRNNTGYMTENGKKILEFVAIQRHDNHQWAIPGGMVEPDETISQTLKAEFSEEALGKLDKSPEESERIKQHMDAIFKNGQVVYKGYVDDPRNTDNAWMETIAVNFHDSAGNAFSNFNLQAGDDACAVRWQRVSSKIPLYASHTEILRQVAKLHNAEF